MDPSGRTYYARECNRWSVGKNSGSAKEGKGKENMSRVWKLTYLGTTSSVLSSSTSDVVDFEVLLEVVVATNRESRGG